MIADGQLRKSLKFSKIFLFLVTSHIHVTVLLVNCCLGYSVASSISLCKYYFSCIDERMVSI